jgi:hypothetical protein
MFEAFRIRARLTPAERSAFDEKVIAGTFTPADLLAQLNNQIELARAGKRSAQSLKQAIILCCVFAALSGVPGLILDPSWLALPAGLIVLAVAFALARRRLSRFHISASVPATAFPFLTVLKHDLNPNEPIRVHIGLSPPMAAAKRTRVSAPYVINAYHKVVDTTYVDAWFEGEARLTDGSRVRWSVTDELRVSVRLKRKTRGRTKRKMGYYKTSQIEVSVSLPVKLYRVDTVPSTAGQKVVVRNDDRRCTINVKRAVKLKSLDPLAPRQLLDSVAVAFRAAKPARGVA